MQVSSTLSSFGSWKACPRLRRTLQNFLSRRQRLHRQRVLQEPPLSPPRLEPLSVNNERCCSFRGSTFLFKGTLHQFGLTYWRVVSDQCPYATAGLSYYTARQSRIIAKRILWMNPRSDLRGPCKSTMCSGQRKCPLLLRLPTGAPCLCHPSDRQPKTLSVSCIKKSLFRR
jgi:hypothetical protein